MKLARTRWKESDNEGARRAGRSSREGGQRQRQRGENTGKVIGQQDQLDIKGKEGGGKCQARKEDEKVEGKRTE